jgi:hypothetical protein
MNGSTFEEWDDLREIALCAALLPDFGERTLAAWFGIRPTETTSLPCASPAKLRPDATEQEWVA